MKTAAAPECRLCYPSPVLLPFCREDNKAMRRLAIFVAAAALVAMPTDGTTSEADLARQLARVALIDGAADLTRLLVVPPPPEASPLPPEEIGRVMGRIAAGMARETGGRIRVLPDPASIRALLADTYRREGLDGWEQELVRLGRPQADLALLAEASVDRDGLALRLRLVELRDGRLVGETDALPVSAPAAPAGDPETALAAALARIAERVPDARAGLAIAPFANGRTGVVTSAGIYLAGLARDAWLAAADTPTAAIRGAAQPAARMNAAPTEGFTLSGTIWLIDASRSGLHLVLAENGIDRASERLEIATLRLPHRVRAMLDPAGLETGRGFAPLRAALAGLGRERLEMVISRGPNPAYRVCADTSPDSVAGCDRLEFALRAGRAGHALCAALGDDGAFGLLAPAAHFRAPAIGPDRWTMLPQDLPPASGGGRVVWPALGDPGATLVLCALFEAEGLMPLAALTPFDGQSLAPDDVAAVAEVLRDASPLSTAHAIVTLIADDLD